MAQIRVNDIFDELIKDNFEINECLNVLIKFKNFVDLVFNKIKTNLESNDLQMFSDLSKEVEDVFKTRKRSFLIEKKSQTESKTHLFDVLSSKPQTSDQKSLQISNDSIKVESKTLKRSKPLTKNYFNRRKALKRREKKEFIIDENGRHVCTFIGCGQRLKSRDSLRSHLRLHSNNPKPFKCDFNGCLFASKTRAELTDHINAHKGIKPFKCEFCGKVFSCQRYLSSHIDYMHNVSDQILVCQLDQCFKEFRTERSLKTHQKFSHLKEKRFVCTEANCDFTSVQSSHLRIHINRVHLKIRPFVCDVEGCSKSYKDRCDLNNHITHCHTTERNFKCQFEGCGKAFKTLKYLTLHTVLHSNIELKCDWPGCDYTTKNKNGLRSHRISHSSELKFTCNWPECGKRFKVKRQMETHLRIHSNDKKFACSWPGCHYRCTDSGNLVKHKRIHIKNSIQK